MNKENNMKFNSLPKLKLSGLTAFFTKIIVLVVIVAISSFYFLKFDLTQDERYTLSQETIDLLESMDDVAEFKIYLEGDALPAGFVKLRNAIDETLDEFAEHANGNIEFEFIDIKDISSVKNQEKEIIRLSKLGIPYLPVEQKKEAGTSTFYVTPGAEVFYNNRSCGVNLLVTSRAQYEQNFNASIEALEYQLSNAIRKLQRERPKNIGFLQLHGESGQYELEDFAKTLAEYYNIGPVFLQNEQGLYDLNSLNLIDILVISGPKTQFNELELVIIDQFVMKGGKLLCILDGIYAELDSLRSSPYFPALAYNSGLEKLLYKYGVRINNDVVEDQQCTRIPIQTGPAGSSTKPELFSWVYFPLIFSENNHLININLDPIKMEFASTLDSIATPGIKHTSLLNTSGLNRYVKTPTRIGFEDAVSGTSEKKLNEGKKCVAFLTEGTYTSYYQNRILPEEFSAHKSFLKSSPVSKMVVISSGTFANNAVLSDNKTLPLGADRYSSAFYDNKKILLNIINYLSDDQVLITVRSKKIKMRLLDKKKVKTFKSSIKWLNLLVPPAVILLISLLFYIVRKKRYS
ncbi:MAG: ABC-2 type transport system permease protein [Glaciecola sp.]|jgi:ABC-2 type transport system permease protein